MPGGARSWRTSKVQRRQASGSPLVASVEIEIKLPETKRRQKHMVHDFESFVVSQIQKRGIEVSERNLSAEELREFKKFLAAKALEAIPPSLHPTGKWPCE